MKTICTGIIGLILVIIITASCAYKDEPPLSTPDKPLSWSMERNLSAKCEAGNSLACFCLYLHCENDRKSISYLKKGADNGNPRAQMKLYDLYMEPGSNPYIKESEAIEYLKKSASQNYMYTQRKLGDLYYMGKFVNRNHEHAEYWYRKSAMQGSGMFEMSKFLEETRTDIEGLIEAYSWAEIGLSQAHPDSITAAELRSIEHTIIDEALKLGFSKKDIIQRGKQLSQENRQNINPLLNYAPITNKECEVLMKR